MNKAFRNIVLCLKQQSIFVVNGEEKLAGYSVGLTDRQMPISFDEKRSTEPNQEQAENAAKQAEARCESFSIFSPIFFKHRMLSWLQL